MKKTPIPNGTASFFAFSHWRRLKNICTKNDPRIFARVKDLIFVNYFEFLIADKQSRQS